MAGSEMAERSPTTSSRPSRLRVPRLLRMLGPGLISGASDDDPTAIATYSQAGAKFGYGLCWQPFFCFPFMAIVQEIGGRVGCTTGRGLAGNVREHFSPWLLQVCVLLLLVANVVTIGADLAMMAEVARVIVGGPHLPYVVLFGTICIGMQFLMPYTRYVAILKWTTLSLFTYCAAALLAKVSWSEMTAALLPRLSADQNWFTVIVAIFGAALSPYIVFWQSAQEAEDHQVTLGRKPLLETPELAWAELKRIRIDTYVGMATAMLVGLAIMVTTAATMHAAGTTDVETAVQAAEALRPVAGPFAFALFALGILGTGFLAVPVLAGSAAYAIGEARGWPVGLTRSLREARAFYATIAVAALGGIALNFTSLDPIRALYWSAVVNGIVAAPILALSVILASRPDVMGRFTISRPLRMIGWAASLLIAASVIGMLLTANFG